MNNSFKKTNAEYEQFFRPSMNDMLEQQSLDLLLLDCDYEISTSLIRLFCITTNGLSTQIIIEDYYPYFYIVPPLTLILEDSDIEQFRIQFNNYISNSGLFNEIESIIKIELIKKEALRNFKGYNFQKNEYLKLYFKSIHVMKKVISKIQKGLSFKGFELIKQTYESKISHPLKFMVDFDLRGMGWFNIKLTQNQEDSNCSMSLKIQCSNIQSVNNKLTQPAFRILSIDFQTNSTGALSFDDDTEILLISCVLHKQHSEINQNIIFTSKFCEQMNNGILFVCKTESEMLQKFHDVFISWDPDFITGYNLHNEILPFIIHRSKKLNLEQIYLNYGRVKGEESIVTQSRFYSTVMRLRETNNVIMNGRVQIDTLICMLRDTKISQYSLGSIYFSIFNRQIEYYDQETVNYLSYNNMKRLAQYSLQKSSACLEIMNYKGWIINYQQIAYTTGVPINYIIMRGQSIKVLSQLLRQSKKFDYLIPDENNVKNNNTSNLQGALVLPAQTGFYKEPLALFDFVSLYPSIVIAYNMCYTTLIKDENIELNEDDYFQIPQTGYRFVKQHVRKGILPLILEDLLKQRAETKSELKGEQNPINYAILDAKQYALKIAANSIFGFTGCSDHGYLPCLEITSSIMKIGRVILYNAVKLIHKNYPNAKILYGDTDSLLVNFSIKNPSETQEVAKQASELVSSHFLSPIKLSFDKLFAPFLLICKKRYVGLTWKNGQTIDKIEHKGICTVRRDNCLYLRKILNLILHQILIEQNFQKAIEIVKEKILKLLNGEVSIYDLIITKSLAITIKENNQVRDEENMQDEENFHSYPDKYHDRDWEQKKQPHIKVATSKVKKNQAKSFQKGDRISYVITSCIPNNQVSEIAEDPLFAFQHKLPLNIQYYVNQIKLPIMHIFEHIIPNPDALFNLQSYQGLKNKCISKQTRHNNEKPLSKYLRKINSCINCNEEIPFNNIICYNCRSSKLSILNKISQELCLQQSKFHKYSLICLKCQNNSYEEIICKNQECHIFYKRQQSQYTLNEIQDKYDKVFNSDW